MNGKGSRQRPRSVSQDEWDENWNRIFKTPESPMIKIHYVVDRGFGTELIAGDVAVGEEEWTRNVASTQKAHLIGSRIADQLAVSLRPFDTKLEKTNAPTCTDKALDDLAYFVNANDIALGRPKQTCDEHKTPGNG